MPQATSSSQQLKILPEVQRALEAGKAVVALESTIISHGGARWRPEVDPAGPPCAHLCVPPPAPPACPGPPVRLHAAHHHCCARTHAPAAGMPFPQNLATAQEVEAVVRSHGAVPATIAIIAGQCCIGLDAQQLEHIARAGQAVRKVSRRWACWWGLWWRRP